MSPPLDQAFTESCNSPTYHPAHPAKLLVQGYVRMTTCQPHALRREGQFYSLRLTSILACRRVGQATLPIVDYCLLRALLAVEH